MHAENTLVKIVAEYRARYVARPTSWEGLRKQDAEAREETYTELSDKDAGMCRCGREGSRDELRL